MSREHVILRPESAQILQKLMEPHATMVHALMGFAMKNTAPASRQGGLQQQGYAAVRHQISRIPV
jgi:hypothetical protein